MSVILRPTGSEPVARLAVLHTQVCVRGRAEATAMPGGCHAAGLVVKDLQGWTELAAFGPVCRPLLVQHDGLHGHSLVRM